MRGIENRLESRLVEKKRRIYGMSSIIPRPRRRQIDDSRLMGKERMPTILSSDATLSMEMIPFEHCPEENGGSRNNGGKRLSISMVKEAWLSEKKEVRSKDKECFLRRERMFSSKRKNVFVEEKWRAF
nr:hypothetical protein [Tanacetum cinerariifolium]